MARITWSKGDSAEALEGAAEVVLERAAECRALLADGMEETINPMKGAAVDSY